jgi:hypothetical protein
VTIRINGQISGRRVDLVIDGPTAEQESGPFLVSIAIMERLAYLAENGGKHRTAEWLNACAQAYTSGRPLPPAPRYKGPLQDLDALTDDALVELRQAVEREQSKRKGAAPLATNEGQGWRSGGGAGQWNG